MKTRFDGRRGLVLDWVRLSGPNGQRAVRMALDTGATATTVRTGILVQLGYDPAAGTERVPMTTASGVAYVPRVSVNRVEALGTVREGLLIVGHTLPPSATVDGLLGLDFFRESRLLIDFQAGEISVG